MSHAPHFATRANCRGRLEQALLRGVDECTRIVRDASKTRRGPQFMKLCPSNTLRSAALSVGQGSSLRVGNDPESGADESRRPECLPWWCLCRDIAQPCRGNPERPALSFRHVLPQALVDPDNRVRFELIGL